MKNMPYKYLQTAGAALLLVTALQPAKAGETNSAAGGDSYTGTVLAVDPKERLLTLKNWTQFDKTFNLGETCAIQQLNKANAQAADLRPGERVVVTFTEMHGVRVASGIRQLPLQIEGMVKAVDLDKHVLTLHHTWDRDFQFPAESRIVLRDGKSGGFNDIRVGNYVTITYEEPAGRATVREIAQTSIPFTGTLMAVDLENRTVKARTAFGNKKFSLANNCAVVVNGKPDGQLSDLQLNSKLLFNYDELNGVNVLTRIGPVESAPDAVATAPAPVVY